MMLDEDCSGCDRVRLKRCRLFWVSSAREAASSTCCKVSAEATTPIKQPDDASSNANSNLQRQSKNKTALRPVSSRE